MQSNETDYVKIQFKLDQGEEGYPPIEYEGLWCKKAGDSYVVDNTPAFVPNVSIGDIIKIKTRGDLYIFDYVVAASKNSSIMVILHNLDCGNKLRKELLAMGCTIETGTVKGVEGLFSACIPATISYAKILSFLDAGQASGEWGFVENARRHLD